MLRACTEPLPWCLLPDPETLWGPLLLSYTRLACAAVDEDAASRDALLRALAGQDAVAPLLRLTAMALVSMAGGPPRN